MRERWRREKKETAGEEEEQQNPPTQTLGIGPFISQTCPGFSAHSALLIFPPS